MAKETKEQIKERLIKVYMIAYNYTLDFESFLDSIANPKESKVFTERTFKTYLSKKIGPEETKRLKQIKKGDIILDTLTASKDSAGRGVIKGQRYGFIKADEVLFTFRGDVTANKTLVDHKNSAEVIKDFRVRDPMFNRHFMVSNIYGCHFRYGDAYLNQFVETAKLRKTYKLT